MQPVQLMQQIARQMFRQGAIAVFLFSLISPAGIVSRNHSSTPERPVVIISRDLNAAPSACPTALEPLITKLLQDLPNYANRVRTRAGLYRNYVLFAGKPDFQPLPLSHAPESQHPKTQQVFFTTLIRRYERDRIVYHQEHHRLFLTPDATGWRFVMMYSVLAPYPTSQILPLPPRNSSEGSIAQAIRDWLRDCRIENSIPAKS